MVKYSKVCSVKRFNSNTLNNDTVYYGAVFIKVSNASPSIVPDLLDCKTKTYNTYKQAYNALNDLLKLKGIK